MSVASRNKQLAYIQSLTDAEVRDLADTLLDYLLCQGCEDVSFYEDSDNLAPYWAQTGEPLIAGQKLYEGEDL